MESRRKNSTVSICGLLRKQQSGGGIINLWLDFIMQIQWIWAIFIHFSHSTLAALGECLHACSTVTLSRDFCRVEFVFEVVGSWEMWVHQRFQTNEVYEMIVICRGGWRHAELLGMPRGYRVAGCILNPFSPKLLKFLINFFLASKAPTLSHLNFGDTPSYGAFCNSLEFFEKFKLGTMNKCLNRNSSHASIG